MDVSNYLQQIAGAYSTRFKTTTTGAVNSARVLSANSLRKAIIMAPAAVAAFIFGPDSTVSASVGIGVSASQCPYTLDVEQHGNLVMGEIWINGGVTISTIEIIAVPGALVGEQAISVQAARMAQVLRDRPQPGAGVDAIRSRITEQAQAAVAAARQASYQLAALNRIKACMKKQNNPNLCSLRQAIDQVLQGR